MARDQSRDQRDPPAPGRAPATRRGRPWLAFAIALAAFGGGAAAWRLMAPDRAARDRPAPAAGEAAPPAGEAAPRSSRESSKESREARVPAPAGPSWQERDDPSRDGWDTEVFSAEAEKQLGALGKLAIHPEDASADKLAVLASADYASGRLKPAALRETFRDGIFKVERGEAARDGPVHRGAVHSGPVHSGAVHSGPGGLGEALRELSADYQGAAEARFKLKIVRVEAAGGKVSTRQLLEVFARLPDRVLEQHAAWTIQWERGAAGAPPRILSIDVEDFEQTSRGAGEVLFADCTESVLGRNPSWRDQLLHGYHEWLDRLQDQRFFAILGTPGVAVGDVDGDGLDDIYLGQEGGLPNRLFLQEPDGAARDVSESSGADWIDSTRGVLLADLDNDGRQDLAAAVLGALTLSGGDGKGRFTVKTVLPTSHDTMSLSAADPDRDGDLDLYVCAYKRDDLMEKSGVISIDGSEDFLYYDANDGAPNALFRNDGSFAFRDVTVESGLDADNRRYSFAASWDDYDSDGDPDLYVSNDFGRNNLYRNDTPPGGPLRFANVAANAGVEDRAASMSASWGDYDRDGHMDIYVGNMFSSAGGRITTQAAFKPDASPEVRAHLQRFARGNTLLRNRGDGTFDDASEAAGVTMGRWAWSSNFVDLNNDAWEDLVVANGYLTTEDPGDL